uniref:Triacylglycerol lipase n=1 Tax=Timema monikensis TaxID=170555 RepID=A0A7R9EFJ9_9NEOP|nr:unnamed protein product [Timema monikensis]
MGRLHFRVQQGVEALLGRGATDDTNNTLAPMEDAKLTAPQLIVKYGYYVEIHHVVTEDGFILELHRIPGSPRNPPAPGKSVFLLEHGLLCSSADWLLQGPGKSLDVAVLKLYFKDVIYLLNISTAYLLADRGFDVWLGNARGNTYSRRHIRLAPEDPQFWNHDWHHMGMFDLPAEIDYILQNTQQQSLYYAGHSMGTTKFFVMGSKRPEYNLKIRTMFALAPIVFMSHMQSPFKRLAFAGETLFPSSRRTLCTIDFDMFVAHAMSRVLHVSTASSRSGVHTLRGRPASPRCAGPIWLDSRQRNSNQRNTFTLGSRHSVAT